MMRLPDSTNEDTNIPALPRQPPALTGWYVVCVLCASLFLSYTDRFIINLVVDPIRADLILTDVQISLLQGPGFALIFAIATLACGRMADSMNRRNLIAAGLLLWSAATVASGFVTDFASFFGARVAVGLGEAALVPAAASLIIDFFSPRNRGTALGVFTLGAVMGVGFALFAGGVLLELIEAGRFASLPAIGELAPWRQLMVLAGLPGFALLPLLLLIPEPVRQHSAGLIFRPEAAEALSARPARDVTPAGLIPITAVWQRLLVDNGAVLRICMVKAILAVGDNGLVAWMPALLQRKYELSPLAVGGALALAVSLSGALASLVGGTASDWFVRRRGVSSRVVLLVGCYALTIIGSLAVWFGGSSEQATLALGIWIFGSISGYVIGHIVMQEWVPNEMRATTVAISMSATALIGITLGPTLVALLAEHAYGGELQSAMGTVSLLAALIGALVIWPPIRSAMANLRSRDAR